MIKLITNLPEFFGDISETLRLFLGQVEISMETGDVTNELSGKEKPSRSFSKKRWVRSSRHAASARSASVRRAALSATAGLISRNAGMTLARILFRVYSVSVLVLSVTKESAWRLQ